MTPTNTRKRVFLIGQQEMMMPAIILESKLSSAPMTTLGVVLYCVICTKTDPLWKGAILPLLLGKSALCTEGFLRRHLAC